MGKTKEKKKSLGFFAMLMMLSCGILNTDLISSNTAVGTSIVFWWLIVGIFDLVPSAFIIRELTLAFPKQGGLYYWVAEGMGPKWGTRVSWLYWATILFLPPASFLMAADLVCMAFFPNVGYVGRVAIGIGLFWLGIVISTQPLSESKHVFNTLGIINILVYLGVFVAGIIYVATGHEPANDLSFKSLMPKLDEALVFVPIIMYCSSGLEICSQSVEDSINPKRDIMRAMVSMIIMCVACNALGSLGVLLITPIGDMSIMSGVADIFQTAFHSRFLYVATIIAVVLGIFGQVCSWLITSARAIDESAKEGEFPKFFAGETKAGLPKNAILINGVFGTIIMIIYAFVADTAADLFFSLMGCSVIVNFIPFILMVHSYVKMKKTKLKNNTECKTPCYMLQAIILQIMQVGVTLLLIYIPGVGFTDDALMVTIGGIVTIGAGEIIIKHQEKVRKREQLAIAGKHTSN